MVEKNKIAVIYLMWLPYGMEHFNSFIESYLKYPAGEDHQLVICFNGWKDDNDLIDYVNQLKKYSIDVKLLKMPAGQDIQAYIYSSQNTDTTYQLFFNTFSILQTNGWLEKYYNVIKDQEVGLISATSSNQSNYSTVFQTHLFKWEFAQGFLYNYRKYKLFIKAFFYWRFLFKPYPNPHVRTTGFMVRREEFLAINPGMINNKFKAYQFESGRKGMTNYYLKKGLKVLVMDKYGKTYGPDEFKNSCTFWIGEQENLLVSDNQTRIYRDADPAYRKLLTKLAWGTNE